MKKKRRYRTHLTFTKGLRDKMKQGLCKELKKEIDDIYERYVVKLSKSILHLKGKSNEQKTIY